jgi:hypothetical protein
MLDLSCVTAKVLIKNKNNPMKCKIVILFKYHFRVHFTIKVDSLCSWFKQEGIQIEYSSPVCD